MSSTPRSFNTKAVVLKNIKYKDTDKIYTVFSEDYGRMSVIGKGVRKITSRRGAHMDTLNVVEIKANAHKSGQHYLEEVKTLNAYQKLKRDLDLMNHAFYIVELIHRTTRHDEYAQESFNLLLKVLARLDEGAEAAPVTVNKFEIKLMQLLGYEPPSDLIKRWQRHMRAGDFDLGDTLVKGFVFEMLGEEIKSLELC